MKKLKKIPDFKSDKEEAEFWDTHDSTEYIDWSKAERVSFPNLKLSKDLYIKEQIDLTNIDKVHKELSRIRLKHKD